MLRRRLVRIRRGTARVGFGELFYMKTYRNAGSRECLELLLFAGAVSVFE